MALLSKRNVIVAVLTACVLTMASCTKHGNPWDKVEGGSLRVLVSFPPLYCFTKGVADKDARVLSLLVATGPHEHRASASDAHVAAGADLFLVNGLTLDDFVTQVANTSGNSKIKIVKVAEALPEDKRLKLGAGHKHTHEDGTEHEHTGEWDPHAWLGIDQAILMVEHIRDTLKEADARNASNYNRRAADYVAKLKKLQSDGKKLLEGKKKRKIIATHDALRYFCKSFDLELVDSIMPRPGVEADNKKIAELQKICEKEGVQIIATEPQYRNDSAETLQQALKSGGRNITIVTIDPMETATRDELNAEYYFVVMRRNLEILAKHMQ
jgi:ABC-type Zn uptake system ZnuABC Zn-binding protein ZnuA